MKASVFLTTATLSVTALAHGGIDKYITGDKVYQGYASSYVLNTSMRAKSIQLGTIRPNRTKEYTETVLILRSPVHQGSNSKTSAQHEALIF